MTGSCVLCVAPRFLWLDYRQRAKRVLIYDVSQD